MFGWQPRVQNVGPGLVGMLQYVVLGQLFVARFKVPLKIFPFEYV